MTFDFTNKTALVTGGTSGIGRSISTALALGGAKVVATYFSSEPNSADELGEAVSFAKLDATDSAETTKVTAAAADTLGGKIDILINNAGGLIDRVLVSEMTDEHFHKVMDVNFTSTFLCTRAVLAHMSDGGRIVNLSSLAAFDGGGHGSAIYSAAKAASVGFTRAMSKELAPRKIRVNGIAPGFIADTAFHNTFTPADTQTAIAAKTPLKRGGRVDEVSDGVLYLASDLSSFVTGETIAVNGGLYFA